jgi:hypothetical protein
MIPGWSANLKSSRNGLGGDLLEGDLWPVVRLFLVA